VVACPKCGSRGLGDWGGDTFCIHCGMRPSIQIDDIDLLNTRTEANPIGVGGGTVKDNPYRFAVVEIETDEGRALLKIYYIVENLKRKIRAGKAQSYERTENYEGATLCDIETMRGDQTWAYQGAFDGVRRRVECAFEDYTKKPLLHMRDWLLDKRKMPIKKDKRTEFHKRKFTQKWEQGKVPDGQKEWRDKVGKTSW
jgi:hypothetical protein